MASQNQISETNRLRLLALCKLAVQFFNGTDWELLDIMTGNTKMITNHERLLRSLSFGDPDYAQTRSAS